MLASQYRFHGHNSLNYVYHKGRMVRSAYCAMRFSRGKANTYRIAVVVNKKVTKSAPQRNRLRRRLYEAIRLQAGCLTNQDIVVTVFDKRLLDVPHATLMTVIKQQLDQIVSWS